MSRLSEWLVKKGLRNKWIRNRDRRSVLRRAADLCRGESGIVHIFGDSHTRFYTAMPEAIVHHIELVTMHRAGRDRAFFLRKMRWRMGRHATIALVFGEIDVRVHIGRIAEQTGTEASAIIDDVVRRFLDAADRHRHGRRLLVVGLVPPGRLSHGFDPVHPDWRTAPERLPLTHLMNAALRRTCSERGFTFVACPDVYADAEGLLRPELSDGSIHIGEDHMDAAIAALRQAIVSEPALHRSGCQRSHRTSGPA